MRLNGRKHGFRIGSGRTIKCAQRLKNLNVSAYGKFIAHGVNNIVRDALEKIWCDHNRNLLEKKLTSKIIWVPKSGATINEDIKQERDINKR